MAYYYRKRRYKKQDDGLNGILTISILAVLAYTYTTASDYIAQHPYGLAVVIAVALVLVALVATLLVRRLLRTKHMYDAITVAAVDTMDGLEFERYLASLLGKMGYTDIRLTEKYDLGIDIIAKKDGITWGVQAKRYNSPVKTEAVRQAYAALKRYKCDRAMVITNSTFSNPAKELANDNSVVLVDRYSLANMV